MASSQSANVSEPTTKSEPKTHPVSIPPHPLFHYEQIQFWLLNLLAGNGKSMPVYIVRCVEWRVRVSDLRGER